MDTTTLRARGHENVTATHETTFEITSDDWLTPAGDCIVGVDADLVPASFDDEFVRACQDTAARIVATLRVADHETEIRGRGDPRLTFENDRSAVFRTSEYVDDRTVMVEASAAAADLDRSIVEALSQGADLECTLRVER
ncbi:MAG: DUF371 domain-containing protein [Natronomonas sp.]